MTIHGTPHDIYWKYLPISDEEFHYPRKSVPKNRTLFYGVKLQAIPFEIDFQEIATATTTTAELQSIDLEIDLYGIDEAQSAYWLECVDMEVNLQDVSIAFAVKAQLERLDLDIELNPDGLEYGTESTLERIDLEISEIESTDIAASVVIAPESIDLEIDEFPVEIIYGVEASIEQLSLEVDLFETILWINIGPTLWPYDLEIDLYEPEVEYGTELDLEGQGLGIDLQEAEVIYGTEVNLAVQSFGFSGLDINSAAVFTPAPAKYIHTTHSQSCMIFYGTQDWLKFRKHAASQKRGSSVMVVHLGPVKPDIVSQVEQFSIDVIASANMNAGEWKYVSQDEYLELVNIDPISNAVIQDGNTYEIPIEAGDDSSEVKIRTDI